MSLPPTTTEQEDIIHARQSRINLIWEITQAFVAVTIVIGNLIVAVARGLGTVSKDSEYSTILSSALFLVVGFYFGRTNHSATGGVGKKASNEYLGR